MVERGEPEGGGRAVGTELGRDSRHPGAGVGAARSREAEEDRGGRKGFAQGGRYLTLVNDLEGGRVLYVAEGREQASLDGFWKSLTPEQAQGIEAVAMDMRDRLGELGAGALGGGRG